MQDDDELARDAPSAVPVPVDFDDPATRSAWSAEFGATEEQLRIAASRVGNMPLALRFYLGRARAKPGKTAAPAAGAVRTLSQATDETPPLPRPARARPR